MRLGPDYGQPQQRLDFEKYLDGLYGYAMVLSRNSAEAEDLVQKTCLRALRGVDCLRSDDSAKSWLFTILRNTWLNQLRHWRTSPDLIELDADENGANEPADAAQDPYTDYVSKVEREQVLAAIHQLPVEFREISIFREYEELSHQEIAALLDCPPGTVMSRLARARSKLRELLSVDGRFHTCKRKRSARRMGLPHEIRSDSTQKLMGIFCRHRRTGTRTDCKTA